MNWRDKVKIGKILEPPFGVYNKLYIITYYIFSAYKEKTLKEGTFNSFFFIIPEFNKRAVITTYIINWKNDTLCGWSGWRQDIIEPDEDKIIGNIYINKHNLNYFKEIDALYDTFYHEIIHSIDPKGYKDVPGSYFKSEKNYEKYVSSPSEFDASLSTFINRMKLNVEETWKNNPELAFNQIETTYNWLRNPTIESIYTNTSNLLNDFIYKYVGRIKIWFKRPRLKKRFLTTLYWFLENERKKLELHQPYKEREILAYILNNI